MGPPARLASIRPAVANAIPGSAAPAIPYSPAITGPQAIEVPCPPISDAAPIIKPASGGDPNRLAPNTPTIVCTTMNAIVRTSMIASGRPPRRRSDSRALRPIVVKK